jgi:hypothetical protein
MRYKYVYLFLVGAFLVTHCTTKNLEADKNNVQPTNIVNVVQPTLVPTGIVQPTSVATVYVDPSADMEYNERQGDKIIVAIETYYKVNGVFPEKLELLIPAYIDELPITKDGREFKYSLNDYSGYSLLFYIPGTEDHGNCAYSHDASEWDCSFYIPH